MRKLKFDKETELKMVKMYVEDKYSIRDIMYEFWASSRTIWRVLKRHNIQRRTRKEGMKLHPESYIQFVGKKIKKKTEQEKKDIAENRMIKNIKKRSDKRLEYRRKLNDAINE
jgi:hypothetical protein